MKKPEGPPKGPARPSGIRDIFGPPELEKASNPLAPDAPDGSASLLGDAAVAGKRRTAGQPTVPGRPGPGGAPTLPGPGSFFDPPPGAGAPSGGFFDAPPLPGRVPPGPAAPSGGFFDAPAAPGLPPAGARGPSGGAFDPPPVPEPPADLPGGPFGEPAAPAKSKSREEMDELKAAIRARNAMVGKRFRHVVVVGELGEDMWLVRCDDCAAEFHINAVDLRKGVARACGCDEREEVARRTARRRAFKVFLATTFLFLAVLGAAVFGAWRYPDTRGGSAQGDVEVAIPKGATAGQVAALLHDAGLIGRPEPFRLYAGQRGAAGRFKAGRYHVMAPATPKQLIDLLVRGVADELVSVTIPEGKNILEIAELFDAAGIAPKAEVVATATDPSFVLGLGLPGPTLEGYLYPDTYKLRPRTPAARALVPLVRRHRQVWAELKSAHPRGVAELRKLGLDDPQMVTLASIVEKETAEPQERPRIAQVFLNRLSMPTFKPKLLQTDPTIVYGCLLGTPRSAACGRWDGRIHRVHLEDKDNPYNTYTHEGLPPGPISNPGRAALSAVLTPDATGYLYFVSRNDGTHVFSKTVAEHEAAVTRFQRAGKPAGGAGKTGSDDKPGASPPGE